MKAASSAAKTTALKTREVTKAFVDALVASLMFDLQVTTPSVTVAIATLENVHGEEGASCEDEGRGGESKERVFNCRL